MCTIPLSYLVLYLIQSILSHSELDILSLPIGQRSTLMQCNLDYIKAILVPLAQ